MEKSKKLSAFYVISAILLFLVLFVGGAYGIYLSVGLDFMRSTISNVTDVAGNATKNVSYGGSVNFQPSMIGVILLSVGLVIISIFDFISLIKQLVFFKQYKLIRESSVEHLVESKVKNKSSVVFFAGLIDVIALITGIVGIFINAGAAINGNYTWVLYLIDGLVSVLALLSLILLIKKVKSTKINRHSTSNEYNNVSDNIKIGNELENDDLSYINTNQKKTEMQGVCSDYENDIGETIKRINKNNIFNIDDVEYVLLKLKNLKTSKVISSDEYNYFREKLTGLPQTPLKKNKSKHKTNS